MILSVILICLLFPICSHDFQFFPKRLKLLLDREMRAYQTMLKAQMTANKSSPSKPASPKAAATAAAAGALDTSVTSVEGEGAETIPEDFEVEEGDGTCSVVLFSCWCLWFPRFRTLISCLLLCVVCH